MQLKIQFGADRSAAIDSKQDLSVNLANCPLGQENFAAWDFPDGDRADSLPFKILKSDSIVVGAAKVETRNKGLEALTKALYEALFEQTRGLYIYRIWHFVPAINHIPDGGLENYQAFCKGRSLAFQDTYNLEMDKFLPAASAVGTTDDTLSLVFIAGQDPCFHLENPLQTPAYQYPRNYGPRAPSFARATAIHTAQGIQLFISGTASIRGSESMGETIEQQVEITIENLKVIEAEFQRLQPEARTDLPRKVCVYLRNSEDLWLTQTQLNTNYLNPNDSVLYIQADICRKELLVEIEVARAQF